MGPAGWCDRPEVLAPLQDKVESYVVLFWDSQNTQSHTTASKVIIEELIFVTRAARHTEALAVANQLHAGFVHPHQTDWIHIGKNATVESTSSNLTGQNQLHSDPIHILLLKTQIPPTADLSIHVGNATVALSCSIELAYLRYPKTFCEGLPHTRAQPVSHCKSNFVAFLWWPYWLRKEVTANFPNILHHLEQRSSVFIVAVLVQSSCITDVIKN